MTQFDRAEYVFFHVVYVLIIKIVSLYQNRCVSASQKIIEA